MPHSASRFMDARAVAWALLFVSLLGFVPPVLATDIIGNYTGVETWTLTGSPYNIIGNATFTATSTLMIEAGVSVVFGGSYTLLIQGKLTAAAAQGDSIVVRSNDATRKGKVTLAVNPAPLSSLSYWKVERLSTGLDVDNAFEPTHCRVTNCGTGVTLDNGAILSESRVDGCDTGIAGASSGMVRNTVVERSGALTWTGGDGLAFTRFPYTVDGCTIRDNIGQGILFVIDSWLNNGDATISGCVIQHNGYSGTDEGIWAAVPTGGDYGANGSRTSNIYVTDCEVVANAGKGIYAKGGINTYGGDYYHFVTVHVTRGAIQSNGTQGVYSDTYTYLYVSSAVVTLNGSYGLRYSGVTGSVATTELHSNGGSDDLYENVTGEIVATNNWWNTVDGVTIRTRIAGEASFVPFLDGPGGNSIRGPYVQGTQMGDVHLTPGTTWQVIDHATIASGKTLQIDPGTVMEFVGAYTLSVQGLLTAAATQGDSIVVRSNDATRKGKVTLAVNPAPLSSLSYWKVERLSTGLDMDNAFEPTHCRVTDCGTGVTLDNGAILSESRVDGCDTGIAGASSGTVRNTVVERSGALTWVGGDGLSFTRFPYTVDGCTIRDNIGQGIVFGIDAWQNYGNATISDCVLQHNGYAGTDEGIRVTIPDTNDGNNQSDRTSNLYIIDSQVMTSAGKGIYAKGGTNTYDTDHYHYVSIRPTGGEISRNGSTGLLTDNYAYLGAASNCKCNNNNGRGLQIHTRSALSASGMTIVGNTGVGLYLSSATNPITVASSSFGFNGTYDFYNDSNQNVTATGNWWNTTNSTQIAQRIYDYVDNNAKGRVTYDPFLTAPPGTCSVADFNCSGVVDGYDLVILALAFGADAQDPNWNAVCDLDASGRIDGFDLARFATHYGQEGPDQPRALPPGDGMPWASSELPPPTMVLLQGMDSAAGEAVLRIRCDWDATVAGVAMDFVYDPAQLEFAGWVDEADGEPGGLASRRALMGAPRGGRIPIGVAWIGAQPSQPDSAAPVELTFRLRALGKPGEAQVRLDQAGFVTRDGTVRRADEPFVLALQIPGATSLLLGPARPNPANGTPVWEMTFPSGDGMVPVAARIYDPAGRLVRTLLNGVVVGGATRQLTWDGLTDGGAEAPAGVYYLRLSSDRESRTSTVLIVR